MLDNNTNNQRSRIPKFGVWLVLWLSTLSLSAENIGFDGLPVGSALVGQDGWVSIYSGSGGTVQAAQTVPNTGLIQTVAPPVGQFGKGGVVSGLIADGIIRVEVLVQYQNGSPIRFAPAGNGLIAAGASASAYFGPQLNVGYLDGTSNQAKLGSRGELWSGLGHGGAAGQHLWRRVGLVPSRSGLFGDGCYGCGIRHRKLSESE